MYLYFRLLLGDLASKASITSSKTEEVDLVDCFDHKTTPDLGFDTKQDDKTKRHESIRWLSDLAEHYADHLQRKKNRYQWRQAANVLNRLFIILLFISITLSIFAVFLAR